MIPKPTLLCAILLSSLLGLLSSHPAPASVPLLPAPTVATGITVVSPSGNAVNPAAELIFSGTKNATSASQSVVIRNDQTTAVTVSDVALSGTNAAAFTITNAPALPLSLAPNATATVEVAFSPNGTVGSLSAQLTITESAGATAVGLHGLSAQGLEGNNEPSLNAIVQTLGYSMDVGGTQLILPKGPDPIGDEVLVPLFQQAGPGPVTMQPVARYSPSGPLAYGYYVPDGNTETIQEVGTIAGDQGQALNPTLSAGTLTFDPGAQTFGFYADVTSYAAQKTFTEDARNTGPLAHAVRTYPVKNRSGAAVPNTYLVCMEPASNGDYQDYVFLVSNVKPATPETGLIDAIEVATGKPYALATLEAGATHYIDRTYTVTSVPDALAGASFIKTANDDKANSGNALLTFTLTQAATVYVAYDPRATALPAWLSSWKKEAFTLGTTDPGTSLFDVYSKAFVAGTVTLGGALASPAAGAQMNYLVAAQPASPSGEEPVVVRINSGGGAVTLDDEAFGADDYFTGNGKSYTNPQVTEIQGTTQDAIYRSERSTTQSLGSFGYAIPVTNGSYTVRLHFAEIYFGAPGGGVGGAGKRVFSVALEGQTVLTNYDINQEVEPVTAVVKTFTTEVTDQELTLNFTASVDQPKVSAIEVFGTGTLITEPPVVDSCAWNALANSALSKVEAQSAKVDGKLYVLAGFLAGLKITGATEIYDPVADSWSTGAPMPTPVTHMGAAVVDDDIWIVAGFVGNHPGVATAQVQIYNTVTNTWRAGPDLPNPRGSGAAVYNNGKLHFFGGLLPDRKTDVGEHYVLDVTDIGTGWQAAASLPNPRNHLSGASVDGLVYAIGGQYGHDAGVDDQKFLDAYDPATDTWTRMADLPSDRSHFEPGTLVHNGKIIIVGGRRGNFFFADVTEYDPATNTWSERCPLPEKLLAPAAKTFGDRLVVANGGENGTCCPRATTRWLPIEPEVNDPAPVSLTLEAEDAALSGAKIATNHPGFSGSGFVDYVNASGDYVEWTVDVPIAGDYALAFTYALGQGNRPLAISVNGTVVASALAFPGTGGWSTWNETEVTVALAAGVNQVRATATGQSGANVDYLTVSSAGDPAARSTVVAYKRSLEQVAEELPETGLGVYPNPATASVTLRTAGLHPNEPIRIRVVGIRGNTVWEQVVKESPNNLSYSLSTERFPAGVYFIRVTQGQTTAVERLVKY